MQRRRGGFWITNLVRYEEWENEAIVPFVDNSHFLDFAQARYIYILAALFANFFFPNREITQNNLKRIGNKSIFVFEPVLFTSFHQVRTAHPWSGPDGKAINFSSGPDHKDVLSRPTTRKLNHDFRYYKMQHWVQKLLAFKVEWCSKLQAKFQLFKARRK